MATNSLAAHIEKGDEMKDLIDAYLMGTREFSAMLEERTSSEIAYDNEVIAGLRKGLSIKKALQIAATKYPDEALQVDDETMQDIKAHYEYLKDHADILAKLKRASGAK
jgi:hypothetical protein